YRFLFFSNSSVDHRALHSFPTRRSSDLCIPESHQVHFGGGFAVYFNDFVAPSHSFALGFISIHYVGHSHHTVPDLDSNSYTSVLDRKSTRLNSSHVKISYAVFCLKKKIT